MKHHLRTWSVWLAALAVATALATPMALQARPAKKVAKKVAKPATKTKKPAVRAPAKPIAPPPEAAAPPAVDPTIAARKVFADRLCASCHTLKAAGIDRKPPPPGPDLSGLAGRMDAAALEAWLRRGQERGGKTHPIRFLGSEAEWQMLSTWLLGVR